MKKGFKIAAGILLVLVIVYCCLPYYARQALIYWYPGIDDLDMFEHHTVAASDSCWQWPSARD